MALPEVQLSTLARPVYHWLVRDDDEDHFDLDAPYQRDSVWTEEQRRGLVKSLIMGIPVGVVIVATQRPEATRYYRVLDGKQRIEAVRAFVADGFTIPTEWVPEEYHLTSKSDSLYSEFDKPWRRGFEMHAQMPGAEFNPYRYSVKDPEGKGWKHYQRTDKNALRHEAEVFLLINGGGTAQTDVTLEKAAAIAAGLVRDS